MDQPPRHVLTNVRLPLPLLKALKHRAVEERRPAAALVRAAVETYLIQKPSVPRPEATARWLRGLIGSAGTSGKKPANLSVDHDHYLYGAPKKSLRKPSRK